MAQTLDANLNVIQETPIELELINGDLSIISKLDDEPNDVGGLTSTELKAKFDEAGNIIKTYLNESLVPAVLAADATEATRSAAEAERVANEQERVSNEGARVSAETERAADENTRAANETVRVSNEEERIAAETFRNVNEAQRIINENAREDLESGYVARAEAAANNAAHSAFNADASATSAASNAAAANAERKAADAAASTATSKANEASAFARDAASSKQTVSADASSAKNAASSAQQSAGSAIQAKSASENAAQNAASFAENARNYATEAKSAKDGAKAAQTAAEAARDQASAIVGGKYTNSTSASIPKGRMRGDVDGDGVITQADSLAITNHTSNEEVITDEIALWCADVTTDGNIRTGDAGQVNKYVAADPASPSTLTSKPYMADYYGNWTYVKVDDISGYFYADIAVAGITATSDALIIVSGKHSADEFSAECVAGAVRITAKLCPIAAIPCQIMWSADGSGIACIKPETVAEKTAIDGMTLNSSTAGSTKKFKLSVDDNGTITAVEV